MLVIMILVVRTVEISHFLLQESAYLTGIEVQLFDRRDR